MIRLHGHLGVQGDHMHPHFLMHLGHEPSRIIRQRTGRWASPDLVDTSKKGSKMPTEVSHDPERPPKIQPRVQD